jgi:hypothetical protein
MNETTHPDVQAGAPAGQPDPAAIDDARDRLRETPSGLSPSLPIGTVESILAAPSDLVEEVIAVPEWGCSVKIRSLTAAEQAKVVQSSADRKAGGLRETFAEALAKTQFLYGVIAPQFSAPEVNQLQHKSGPGFARVIRALDRISGINRKEMEEAAEAFQESGRDGTDTE